MVSELFWTVLFSFSIMYNKTNKPESLKVLVSQFAQLDGQELVSALDQFSSEWSRPRGDLCAWMTLLDRFDDILENMVQKYGLTKSVPTPMSFEPLDEQLLVSVLRFSAFLLQKCSNRGVYASSDRVSNLIKCSSPFVLEAALRVCVELAQRFAQSRLGRPNVTSIDPEMIFKMVRIIPEIYESTVKEEAGITTCPDLRQFIEAPQDKYPSKLDFQFYVTKRSHSGMQKYHLAESDLRDTSLMDIHSSLHKCIPEDVYFDAMYRTWGVRSVALSSNGVELRQTLVKIQLLALGFASCSLSEETLESRIMDHRPQLIKQIGGLAFPDGMPSEIRVLALDTLSYVCHQQTRRADVLAAVSGNVSHGALMTSIRSIITALQNGESVDENFSSALFATIIHIAASHSLCMILVSAGLVPLLLELVQVRNDTKCVRTLSAVMELLDHVIIDVPATFPIFTQSRGVPIMIEAISREVDYDIAHQDEERPNIPDYCLVDHEMSYFRSQWIRSLFVVVSNILTHIRGSENVHNVVDSPLMQVTKLVVSHSQLFGSKIVSLNLQIVSAMLENEAASAFGIMHESKVIDALLDAFPTFLSQSSHAYFAPVLRVLGAFAQSDGGQQMLKEKKLIEWFFEKLSLSDLAQHDNIHFVGNLCDSIAVEHAELRPLIVAGSIRLLKTMGDRLDQMPDAFYSETEGPPTGLELIGPFDEIPAKKTATVRSLIRFIDGLLKSHLMQIEFMKYDGVEQIFLLVERDGIPYDLIAGQLLSTLGRLLRLIFSLDIASDKLEKIVLNHINCWVTSLGQHLQRLDVLRTDSGDIYLRTLSKLSIVIQLSYNMIFFDYGTGYRLLSFMKRIVQQDLGKDVISHLLTIQRKVIQVDSRTRQGLSDQFLVASKPVTEDSYREIKRTQLELEDASSVFFSQVKVERFLCAAVVDSISKISTELGALTSSERALNDENKKYAFKMAEIIGRNLALDATFCCPSNDTAPCSDAAARIVQVMRRILFKRSAANSSAYLIVYAMFRQQGGLGALTQAIIYFMSRDQGNESDSRALKELLGLITTLVTPKNVVDNNRFVQAATCLKSNGYFYPSQFLVECQLLVFSKLIDNNLLSLMTKLTDAQLKSYLYLLQLLWDPTLEVQISEQSIKTKPMPFLSWRQICPTESKVNYIVQEDMAGPEEAASALLLNQDNLKNAIEYLGFEPDLGSLDVGSYIEEEPLGSTYGVGKDGSDLVGSSDLDQIRQLVDKSFLSSILEVLIAHPSVIFQVSAVLKALISRNTVESVDKQLALEIVTKINETEFAENSASATLTHLLGILLQDFDWLYKVMEVIWPHFGIFVKPLKDHAMAPTQSWYPALLFVIERLVTAVDVPEPVKPTRAGQPDFTSTNQLEQHLDLDLRDGLFDQLAKAVTVPAEAVSVLATARLFVHYSKDVNYASKMACSDVLDNLLTRTAEACKTGKQQTVTRLHTAVILVVRQTIESSECIMHIMREELQKYFDSTRSADVVPFLKSHYYMICRNVDIFRQVVCEQLACTDNGSVLTMKATLIKRLQRMRTELGTLGDDLDLAPLNLTEPEAKDRVEVTQITHKVVQMLMNQILSLKVFESLDEDFKREKNADYIHCCFVLQCLAEIATYNDCKLAMVEKGHRKRSAFGYLLQEVLPVGTLTSGNTSANQQRNTVAGMAMGVLENVLWCGAEDQALSFDTDRPLSVALQTVRKVGIDLIARTLREVFNSQEPIEKRYVLLGTICELCYRIIGKHRGVEYNSEDGAALAHMMYERKFASILTGNLGEMDINFPGIKKVIKSGVKFLTKLSLLSVDDLNKEPHVSDDDEDEIASALGSDLDSEYDDRETPDLFRNSTLGMYEVEQEDDGDMDEDTELPEESDIMDYDEVNDEAESDVENSDDEPYGEVSFFFKL